MKVRNKDLVSKWAARPDVFALEPSWVQEEFGPAVEKARESAKRKAEAKAVKPKAEKKSEAKASDK